MKSTAFFGQTEICFFIHSWTYLGYWNLLVGKINKTLQSFHRTRSVQRGITDRLREVGHLGRAVRSKQNYQQLKNSPHFWFIDSHQHYQTINNWSVTSLYTLFGNKYRKHKIRASAHCSIHAKKLSNIKDKKCQFWLCNVLSWAKKSNVCEKEELPLFLYLIQIFAWQEPTR